MAIRETNSHEQDRHNTNDDITYLTKADRGKLDRLRRRAEWLKTRTDSKPHLSYDLAEMAALNWAIDMIEQAYA